jgi:hypothetical protein
LKQVQEMQSNCDKGLKHMSCEAPLLGPMAELWLVHHDILTKKWFAFPFFIHSTQCLSINTKPTMEVPTSPDGKLNTRGF